MNVDNVPKFATVTVGAFRAEVSIDGKAINDDSVGTVNLTFLGKSIPQSDLDH